MVYLNGALVGFGAARMNDPEEGEGILAGVVPGARKHGIYHSLLTRRLEWCLARGAKRMIVSTQLINTAVQRVWIQLGFEPVYAQYTFHKWFD